MADGFIWYELVTNDVDKAVNFYKKVVGWDIKDSGMPGMKYMLFGKNGKDVGGMMTWAGAGAPELPTQWMGHIHTAKLDEELKAVTADGGTIVKPAQDIPGVGRFAVVLDPQKVKYLLFEPGKQDAPPRLDQMAVGNVGWHELLTDDQATAFDYYSKHYGWQKDFAHDMGAMGTYQTFRTDKPLYTGGMMNRKRPRHARRHSAALAVLLHRRRHRGGPETCDRSGRQDSAASHGRARRLAHPAGHRRPGWPLCSDAGTKIVTAMYFMPGAAALRSQENGCRTYGEFLKT